MNKPFAILIAGLAMSSMAPANAVFYSSPRRKGPATDGAGND